MNESEVIRLGQEALRMTLLLSVPLLGVAVIIGTIVSLVQAVTQVHEQTLTFLPKLLGICAVLAFGGGWMIEQTVSFGERSLDRIPAASRGAP
ncbi:MAG: flagellar biosynthesis protein FliQ [Deltaproteobacteria bacterium]|nr:flagellar biosynthesis protein FliQ [Deltaproteobacteria bacterium]